MAEVMRHTNEKRFHKLAVYMFLLLFLMSTLSISQFRIGETSFFFFETALSYIPVGHFLFSLLHHDRSHPHDEDDGGGGQDLADGVQLSPSVYYVRWWKNWL